MKKLLHIALDEKFIDRAIHLFSDALPLQNEFLIWKRPKCTEIEHVKLLREDSGRFVSYEEPWWKEGYLNWGNYHALVLHNGFSQPQVHFARQSPPGLPKVLIYYGAEFYENPLLYKKSPYGPLTEQLSNRYPTANRLEILKIALRKMLRPLSKRIKARHPSLQEKADVFRNIDYLGTHVRSEQELINTSTGINSKLFYFSYYSIQDFSKQLSESSIKRNRVIVGNSASLSNNHLDAFKRLSDINYDGEVYCPLSYGDTSIQKIICEAGKRRFGTKFHPVIDFLKLDAYNTILSESTAMIMPHYRQQAVGNIISGLWLGLKVFISQNSPLVKHFREIGCSIYTIETDLKNSGDLSPIAKEEASLNRESLNRFYASSRIKDSIVALERALP